MNILVSGIAGDIGISIGQILQRSVFGAGLIGCDIHSEFHASDIFRSTHILPRVGSTGYLAALRNTIREHSVDVFIPSSEPELRWLADNPGYLETLGARCILASQYAMEVSFDKLTTSKHLKSFDLPTPWSVSVSDSPNGPPELPCILKSRAGAGNSAVHFVDDREKCNHYSRLYPSYIWQEYLPETKGEFTCGVYRCLDDSVRVIAMRRRLAAGVTAYAQVVHEASIIELCRQIAESLDLRGSINVQLRLVEGRGPVVFEINPRFSSTVGMRHRIGFCDLIWSIQEQYLQVPAFNAPNVYPEVCFSRRFAEFMV